MAGQVIELVADLDTCYQSPAVLASPHSQAQQKGTKSSKSSQSKLLTSQSHLAQLGSTLTTSLPPFLLTSQSLDRSHAAFLKESLVRHGTISSDLGRERMEMGERLLVGVFEIDELAEMQGWALREGQKTATGRHGSLNGAGAGLNEFGSLAQGSGSARTESIAEEREGQMLPPPVPQPRERQSSNARAPPPPVAPVPVPTSTNTATSAVKSGGSKLKGLFKRDRSSSAAGSSKYGNLNGPAAGSSTNVSHSYGADRTSIASSRETESLAEQPEQPSALPNFNRTVSAASSTMRNMPPPIQPDKTLKKRDSLMPFSSGGPGGLFRRASKMTTGSSPAVSPAAADRAEPRLAESPVAQGVDEEGFSVPPAGYDKQPWEQAQHASASANLMDDDDDEAADGLGSIGQGSRLPSVALAPAAITETNEDRAAALAKVQSALLSSPPSSGAGSPLGGLAAPPSNLSRRTTRGRRDVRMTMYQPGSSTDDMPLANLQQRARQQSGDSSSPVISPPLSPIPTGASAFGEPGRANSILSTTSGSTAVRALGGVRDPFEGVSTPGLRANIVETVNVLSKGGEVSRVMIQGEISLSHKPISASSDPIRIRITNFEQFEKAAPNSAYIQPLADSPGEYNLLPTLASHGSTATVLKYQVFVTPGQEAFFTPLHVKAAWKTEPTLTRVMITYEPNPMAVFAGKSSSAEASPFGEDDDAPVQLEDVAFLVPVGVPVASFQAKPSATWSAEKRRLGFSVEPVALGGGAGEAKLLASLVTEGQAGAGAVGVRWRVAGRTVSAVGVEVVGSGGERVEEVRRATVTGKYLVAP